MKTVTVARLLVKVCCCCRRGTNVIVCVGDDVAAPPVGEWRERAGDPTESSSCEVVRPVPRALRSRHAMRPFGISAQFYDKFTEAYGIPVVGQSRGFLVAS